MLSVILLSEMAMKENDRIAWGLAGVLRFGRTWASSWVVCVCLSLYLDRWLGRSVTRGSLFLLKRGIRALRGSGEEKCFCSFVCPPFFFFPRSFFSLSIDWGDDMFVAWREGWRELFS